MLYMCVGMYKLFQLPKVPLLIDRVAVFKWNLVLNSAVYINSVMFDYPSRKWVMIIRN